MTIDVVDTLFPVKAKEAEDDAFVLTYRAEAALPSPLSLYLQFSLSVSLYYRIVVYLAKRLTPFAANLFGNP